MSLLLLFNQASKSVSDAKGSVSSSLEGKGK